jgi:hypothetical protein
MGERLAAVQESALSRYRQLSPYLPALFFSGGFFFDILTLGRIDNILNIISHGFFLVCSMILVIMQITEITPRQNAGVIEKALFDHQNDAIHFMLGALLNAFVIFYFKSGSLINTFLLLLVLFVLLLLNEIEFFKQKGPTMKMVLLTISLCSFFIYLIPVLIGRTGSGIFLVSQFCAGLVILAVWQILLKFKVDFVRLKNYLLVPAASVIVIFSLLYAAGVIPPVPLSLKQIGIYHNIERQNGRFILSHEVPSWNFWSDGDQDFQAREGDRIYLFSRIFAPGGFKDKLYFHFQIKNRQGKWQTTDRIPLTIVGGRDAGFRGYAYKQNYREGEWRALVETTERLEIGRINFTVNNSSETAERAFNKEIY